MAGARCFPLYDSSGEDAKRMIFDTHVAMCFEAASNQRMNFNLLVLESQQADGIIEAYAHVAELTGSAA